MTSDLRMINLIFESAGIVLSLTGLIQAISGQFIKKRTKGFFIAFFGVLSAYALCYLVREVTYDKVGMGFVILSRIIFFSQAFLSGFLTVLMTAFLLTETGEEHMWKNPVFITSFSLWVLYVALLVSAQFGDFLYSVDNNNVYTRGHYFPVVMIIPMLIMVINLIGVFIKRKELSRKQKAAFLIYMVFPMISMLVQTISFGLNLIVITTVIAALFMLTYIITDQTEKYVLSEAENSKLKIDILLAQIQPHFLFNTLTSIKYLCSSDPEKAETALTRFTEYLRYNMDSISIDTPVPFENELRHVNAFLSIQKIRFGDDLNVKFDISTRDFTMPILTLQPIVENAVSYGVRRSENGQGTITIRTLKEEDVVKVSVEDDGPGFVYEALPDDKERSHTGIKNVRERIERISHGKLIVDSKIGEGTVVTIVLPYVRGE